METDRINQINISFVSNELKLFDIEKRVFLGCLKFENRFVMMSKMNRDLYVGTNGALFGVDWRRKEYLVSLYRDGRRDCNWMSDPLSKSFWVESGGDVVVLGQDFRKVR